MTGQQLQAAVVAEARLADRLTQAYARELEQTLILLNARIRRLIRALESDGRVLVSTRANLARALALRQGLKAAIEDAGVLDLSRAAIDAPLDQLSDLILSRVLGRAATVTPFDLDALAAFKDLRLAELLDVHQSAVATIQRTVLDGVLGARPIEDLIADIEDVLDATAADARTVYDTAVSTFSRQVDQLHTTGAPDELFVYLGPADFKTRPFCREHVGKVYQRHEIDDLDNGQLPNVLITGGGYNCRHAWKPVSILDDELLGLHRTGGRLAIVEDQLRKAVQ